MKNKFIMAVAFSLVMTTLSAQPVAEKKYKAYMVADAHLDTQWNWDVQATIKDHIWRTLTQNLFLLEHYPDYIFNFEGAVKYMWMKEYYPEQFEELRKYVKLGRWHFAGSTWESTETLIQSPESEIRNILLGQTFFRKEFGTEGTDLFFPDSFGFGWTLPSVAAHCGLIGFSSQKLEWRYKPFYGNSKLPYTIGLWEGVDSSKIMMAHGFDYGRRWPDEDLSQNKMLKDEAGMSPLNTVYRYYGTGDTGGSPTITSVRAVEKGLKGNGPIQIVSATSDQLYKDYLPFSKHPELPVFNGELLLDVHGTGCYTSQAAMKLYNRQNEQIGDATERSAVMAECTGGSPYPTHTLTDIWRKVIWHQFHDDLPGTCIPKAYEFSWNDELLSLKRFSSILTSSVNSVADEMDTRTKGVPVIFYNAHGFNASDIVTMSIPSETVPKGVLVTAPNGKQVPAQLISYNKGKATILVDADVPAMGTAIYDVRFVGPQETETSHPASVIENSVYKITFNSDGDITSLIDKRYNKELVESGKVLGLELLTPDNSYNWPAWEVLKTTIDEAPVPITQDVKMTLVENCKLRKTICVEKKYGKSVFKQYIRLYEGSKADQIDFNNVIDWKTQNAFLKAAFPLSVANDKASYDIGLGNVKRENNKDNAYEVYAHEWTDLTDRDNSYGVSILNNCKYGWDKPDDNTLRLSLIHTPGVKDSYTYQANQDLGHHVFTYSIIGHKGALNTSLLSKRSEILNQPIFAFASAKHNGKLGKEFSLAASDNDNVRIKAFKKAELSDEYVLRVYEMGGKEHQEATITFPENIRFACEADGTEKKIGEASYSGKQLHVSIDPYHIKTYKLTFEEAAPQNINNQEYIPLKYNLRCFSYKPFRSEANFDGGYSYAAEILSDSILKTTNNISFKLGDKDANDGLACNGDTILLPHNCNYSRIYLLAASRSKDREAVFTAGGKKYKEYIPYYSGFVGQWGHDGQTKGYLKNADVAYIGEYRHSFEGNEPYEYTYMFKIGIDIPKGAKMIILPKDDNIVLFAATLADEKYPEIIPVSKIYETALKENGDNETVNEINLLKGAKILNFSGEYKKEESASNCIDGNLDTKWCDVSPAPNYIDFDLGKEETFSSWKLVNAGDEAQEYVTRSCFLMGRNSLTEEWKPIDGVNDNRNNIIERVVNATTPYRYIRLLITQPTQNNDDNTARIYELALYK